mgnify:CR=1 FL=1
MKDGIHSFRRFGRRIRSRFALHVEIYGAIPTAEGFFLAGIAGKGRMLMLGTSLAGGQHKLFGTNPVGVYVCNKLKAGGIKIV